MAAGALGVLAISSLAAAALAVPAAAEPTTTGPAASVSPNALLQNLQVVTVSWSGFPASANKPNIFTGYDDDDVALIECTADPPGGQWYYFRDCYTSGENLGGDIVAPSPGIQDTGIPLEGATAPDGSGSYPFQVQEGTLQTQEVDFPCGTTYSSPDCNSPYSIQCDDTHPCVIKVVTLPNGAPPIPNELWQGPPTPTQVNLCASNALNCTFSQLLDAAPSVALAFGSIPDCPTVTSGNLNVEGAASSSYALESWAAALCSVSHPVTISYADVGEDQAKNDLLAGNTNVAVASLAPTTDQTANAVVSTYKEAPLDSGGVSIVFNMVDPLTGLPIGCSANQPATTCATPIRLTPRLAAMLITNSATINAQEPFGHLVSGSSKRFIEPLTEDPEFEALNPGFQPPAICVVKKKKNVCTDYVEEPVLRAEQTDDTFILTQWIADDYDARRFLAGQDPCGAQLNEDWDSVAYPSAEFRELAESSSGTTPDSDSYYPETGTQNVLQSLLYGIPVGGPPPSPGSPKSWLPAPTDNYAFFGVVDSVSAHRSGLPSAQLIAASPDSSQLQRFVTENGAGSCTPDTNPSATGFVADNAAGLDEAYRIMKPDDHGFLLPPVTSTDPDAYPLAKIDYALIPSTGLSTTTEALVASLLRFSAGAGQSQQYLPPGYSPLPTNLDAQALTVANSFDRDYPEKGGAQLDPYELLAHGNHYGHTTARRVHLPTGHRGRTSLTPARDGGGDGTSQTCHRAGGFASLPCAS